MCNRPSDQFIKRAHTIIHSSLPGKLKKAYFELAVDLEYDLLPQVELIMLRKYEKLVEDNRPKVWDDEKYRAFFIERLIRNWRLT